MSRKRLKEKQVPVNSELAAPGDTIELIENWRDASGIMLFMRNIGEQFIVLMADLTTGGVIVRDPHEHFCFSLAPEKYKIVKLFVNKKL